MQKQPAGLPVALLLLAAGLLSAGGCDIGFPGGGNPGDDGPPPLQTQIFEMRVEPDTVAVGDTARFTAVTKDSTDSRFGFHWSFGAGSPNGAVTKDSTVLWTAPEEDEVLATRVRADRGSGGTPPSKASR